jgi:protein phosphatase
VRANNQDGRVASERLFAVADGMGGHRGGEVASQIALTVLESNFAEPHVDALHDAARDANDAIYQRSEGDPDLRGMGTTLVVVAPVEEDDALAWISIGDSRLYLMRDGELQQLSEDDSLVEEWVRGGIISADEAREHPQRNIVTKALGIEPHADLETATIIPYTGDRYILCSDGLFGEVEDARIAATLRRLDDPADAASELVRLANESGGRDNITVVIVDVVDDGDRAGAASAVVTAAEASRPTPSAGDGYTAVFTGSEPLTEAVPAVAADAPPKPKRAKPKRFTWRVFAFVVLVLFVVGATIGAIGYEARHSYYVGYQGNHVTIFKGKPGGVLWFHPTVERDTGLVRGDVPQSQKTTIENGHEADSLAAAQAYVDSWSPRTQTTTTTTTTTSIPTTQSASAPTLPGTTAASDAN